MVWKISKKMKKPSKEDIQQTALNGVYIIVALGILAWIIEHFQYVG